MRFGHILKMRLRSLFGRTRVEDEVRRELEVHLEQLIRDKNGRGYVSRGCQERRDCVTSGISGSGRSSRGMSAACGISMISPTISRSPSVAVEVAGFYGGRGASLGSESAGIQRFLR
jgi:hypothetical protein